MTQQTYPKGDLLTTAYTLSTGQPSGLSIQRSGALAPIRAGQAAYWEDGERHTAGSSGGVGALVIEGPSLDLSTLKPLAPDDENAPA